MKTTAVKQADFDKQAQDFDIPIDEVKAITLKVSPTYALDTVESVTLKSFRKVVGYDTFNSILKKDRDEKKDIADHYNVTVSMMVKRNPEAVASPPIKDPYDGTKTLAQTLDKGFPYDDADNQPDDQVPNWRRQDSAARSLAQLVGKLNGENVTKSALVNLVRDVDAPITSGLVQLDEMKSDADNLSTLFDSNVTRGALKNLVTDKPSPITTKLAQKSDADNLSTLFDSNVTRGALKNLVTDKPSPITTKLAQKSGPAASSLIQLEKSDADNLSTLFDSNVTRGALKNLVTDKPSPITTKLAQTSNPVRNPPFNNWSVNQPSPPHQHGMKGNEDLGMRDIIIDGVNYDLVQTSNPVENPPFNNWSVNQPSPPHQHGLDGKADLGQNIIVDGHHVRFAQKPSRAAFAQLIPMTAEQNQPGNFAVVERNANRAIENL